MEVEKELKKHIINRFMHGDSSKFNEDESLFEKGIIDSLGVLELISFIEKKFAIQVDDEELIPENFETFNKILEFVETKLNIVKDREKIR